MIYLLWGIFNFLISLFFLFICIKATKCIYVNIGLFAAIVFVFGHLSCNKNLINDNGCIDPNSNQYKTWEFIKEDSLNNRESNLLTVELENNMISQCLIGIKYVKDKQGKLYTPTSAYSFILGYTLATNWRPMSIIVNNTNDNNKFEYFVNGIVEWKILGNTIYTQPKVFKGMANIK